VEDAITAALIKQLQPLFYYLGAGMVLIFVAFGGTILKLWMDSRKDKELKDTSVLERLIKVEVKLDKVIDDLNNIGKKVRLRS
jgi:hypothetical protein